MGLQQPTFKEKFRRWYNLHYKGMVTVKTISRDQETGGYRMDIEEVPRCEVPTEALKETGNSYSFTIDKIKKKYPYREHEKGFSAIDLCLWMESNDINDALAYKWNNMKFFDDKGKWIVILVIAGLAVLAFYVFKGSFIK